MQKHIMTFLCLAANEAHLSPDMGKGHLKEKLHTLRLMYFVIKIFAFKQIHQIGASPNSKGSCHREQCKVDE